MQWDLRSPAQKETMPDRQRSPFVGEGARKQTTPFTDLWRMLLHSGSTLGVGAPIANISSDRNEG